MREDQQRLEKTDDKALLHQQKIIQLLVENGARSNTKAVQRTIHRERERERECWGRERACARERDYTKLVWVL